MGKKTLGNFSLAQEVKKTVEKIATDKVEQLRPAAKTARVDSINTVEKYCMVTFVGESLSVKVPYNNVAPSFVGQFVRVGGPANDRRIEEVLGVTESEDKLSEYEKRLAFLELKAYATASPVADFTATTGVPKVPNNQIRGTPKNIEVNSFGEFVISISGNYQYFSRVQVDDYRDAQLDLYVAVLPTDGGAQYDIDRANIMFLWGSGEYSDGDSLVCSNIEHFNAGDKVWSNIGANKNMNCHAFGTRMWLNLIDPDPIAS